MKQNPKSTTYFYQGDKLITVKQGAENRTILRIPDLHLAEHHTGAGQGINLLATDGKGSVLKASNQENEELHTYSAYGHDPLLPSERTLSGFNGERIEASSKSYLLGNGYRAYNPVLMRFHAPDTLSPFDKGGMNAYTYCQGDPVNRSDPSGHNWITNLFKSPLSRMNSTAKKLNQRILQSTQQKHFILEHKTIKDYSFEPAARVKTSTVVSELAQKNIQKLDNKIANGFKKLKRLETAAGATAKLDSDNIKNLEKIQATNHIFIKTLQKKEASHQDYLAWREAQPEASKSILGWFDHFNAERMKTTRIRRGLDN